MFNASHLHLMLNHIPIIGTIIVLFFFTFAVIYKRENNIKQSFIFYIAIAIMAEFVFATGDPSAEIIKKIGGINESLIEEHENYAFISLMFFILMGVISMYALYLYKKSKIVPAWLKYSAVVISFISVLSVAYTAKTGGEIMHPEITNELKN